MGRSSDAAMGNKIIVVSHGKLAIFITINLLLKSCLAAS